MQTQCLSDKERQHMSGKSMANTKRTLNGSQTRRDSMSTNRAALKHGTHSERAHRVLLTERTLNVSHTRRDGTEAERVVRAQSVHLTSLRQRETMQQQAWWRASRAHTLEEHTECRAHRANSQQLSDKEKRYNQHTECGANEGADFLSF